MNTAKYRLQISDIDTSLMSVRGCWGGRSI